MVIGRRLALLTSLVVVALVAPSCGGDDGEAAPDEGGQTGPESPAATLLIAADTVSGPANIPEDQRATSVCVLQSRFPRNSEIVWRARVSDPSTGEELDDTVVESVQVVLADGQTFDMRYGPHPQDEPTDFFWTTSFDVPADYPTGTLDYEIVATDNEGRTGRFVPFQVAPSLLTVTDEVLETIEEEE